MSFITSIGIANPTNRFSQSVIADFMERTMVLHNGDHRKVRTIFKLSGIEYRHSVLEDYGKSSDFSFYPNTDGEPFPSTEKRLKIFRDKAVDLSIASVHNLLDQRPGFDKSSITHVVAVCCTGMYAPGLDIDLVKKLGLRSTVQRTCINFMGCYAAFNALKLADAFCRSDKTAKVLIVCTELCSLHFQRNFTDDNVLANALFADGSAAVLVEAESSHTIKLVPESFHSDLAIDGERDMAWTVGDLGFEMKLSSYVPDIIQRDISHLTNSLLSRISKNISQIKYFAIHPGGKKILQAIEEELGITKEQNADAYQVLKDYGNMSSPTVLFVLQRIFQKITTDDNNEHILSFAFGPGLTLESMVLKIVADK
jgi:prepilin-type processing-associated H-X9-DG protein